MKRHVLGLAIPLLFGVPVSGQGWTTQGGETVDTGQGELGFRGDEDLQAVLDALLASRVAADGPGLALCVRLEGELVYAGARGLADLEHRVPWTSDTVFDMASISKSVTGAAVAALVESGKLDLDAGIRTYLPELSSALEAVQVRHLVHHTAGIEDLDGLLVLAGRGAFEPITFEEALRPLLGLRHVRFAPGTQHMYSNGGYVLLAEIVRRASGVALPDWARAHLFEPLGMKSARLATRVGELVPDAAFPYERRDGERVRLATSAYCGAGGLLCSVRDLARLGDELRTGAHLGAQTIQRMREAGRLADGTELDYACGLGRTRIAGHAAYSHSGSIPGGQCFLAFFPDDGLVVAAATNDGDGPSPYALAAEVTEHLLGSGTPAPARTGPVMNFIPELQAAPAESKGLAPDPETLLAFEGVYRMSEGPVIAVASRERRLLVGFDMEPSIEVFPLPSGRFLLPSANYEFSFDPAHDRLTFHVTEKSVRRGAPRDIVGTRWKPAAPDEKARAALVGTYRSDELGAYYELAWREGGFRLEHPHHGSLALRPFTPDVYTLPGGALAKLTVVRQDGRVTGVELQAKSWSATSFFRRL